MVVAEYVMPWIDGPALLDAMRESHPGVPVIFLTGADDTERAVEIMRAGAADYLIKTSRGFLRLPTAVSEAVAGTGPSSATDLPVSPEPDLPTPREPPPIEAVDADLARLERINADLRGLIAQTVHELDAPLLMVAQHARTVEGRSDALDAEGRRSLDLALAGVNRMQELLDDLGSYARIESEAIAYEACECNALVDRLVQQLSARRGVDHVRVRRSELPTVQAERSQLTQVLENLLSNALKFQTETPASVEISARAVGEEWLFSVRDQGIGVEPALADSIFLLFKRLRPDYPGTGVGLAIYRRVVERHGGRIWVESPAGGGSTFHFTLPRNPIQAARPCESVARGDGRRSVT